MNLDFTSTVEQGTNIEALKKDKALIIVFLKIQLKLISVIN